MAACRCGTYSLAALCSQAELENQRLTYLEARNRAVGSTSGSTDIRHSFSPFSITHHQSSKVDPLYGRGRFEGGCKKSVQEMIDAIFQTLEVDGGEGTRRCEPSWSDTDVNLKYLSSRLALTYIA